MERKDIEGERKKGQGIGGGGRRKDRSKEDTRKVAREQEGREKGREQGDCCWSTILTSLPSLSCPKPEQ